MNPELYERDADERKEDHYVHLDVKWADYQRLLAAKGERSIPRFHYLDGLLEIMSPSPNHELIGYFIGRLLETYCLDRDIEIVGVGSWTIKKKGKKAAAEPDECYLFGGRRPVDRPDLAIEVIWTSGGLDKLDVYSRLGVPEVWFWRKGQLQIFRLRGERYRSSARSQFVPDLDPKLLCRFLDRPSYNRAARDFRKALKKAGH